MMAVVLEQCSKAMKAKVESEDSFETISNARDEIAFLKFIRSIAFDYKYKH